MVRVERLTKPSGSDKYTLRFRGEEWQVSRLSVNLESELKDRFGEVSPDDVIEIILPNSHIVLFLEGKELADLTWE
jgi:hypothetical protein